jgi:threonine/homoserine/homoserine lactone efflux protein
MPDTISITLSLSASLALFGTLLILALVPSMSVLAVTARAASAGLKQGTLMAMGIACGDMIYVLVAIFGLAGLATQQSALFIMMQVLASFYLLWLGISLSRTPTSSIRTPSSSTSASSFLTGLLLTLGDYKAILFYLGFLPAFVNLSLLTVWDTLIILALTALAVGGAKFVYAILASRSGAWVGGKSSATLRLLAGLILIAVSVWLAVGILRTLWF